jgi:phosphoglycolate phosphatase
VRAAIFDLDGTLADTLQDIAFALNHALGGAGLPALALEQVRQAVGAGADTLVRRVTPGLGAEQQAALVEEFRRAYAEHLLDATHAYPGVPELLAALGARGLGLAVLTNKPEEMSRAIVQALFPDIPFAAVVGQAPSRPLKPDPSAALALAERLGEPAGACLFVGDSGVDMQTATRAGMFPVGVLWGFRGRAELLAEGARALLERPAELLALLEKAG